MQITKTTVTATVRALDPKWRVIYKRWDMPAGLDLRKFPHKVQVNQHIQALAWCTAHVGELDHAWTYKDSDTIMFQDKHDAIQFKLSL